LPPECPTGSLSRGQNAQGIEAEIPEALGTKAEELERIARSPRRGDAPNINSTFGLFVGNRPVIDGFVFLTFGVNQGL
jgi:hypothetical protein